MPQRRTILTDLATPLHLSPITGRHRRGRYDGTGRTTMLPSLKLANTRRADTIIVMHEIAVDH